MIAHDEAIAIAKEIATRAGWPWQGRVHARRTWFSLFEPRSWIVTSNTESRENNVRVIVDARTGKVVQRAYRPPEGSWTDCLITKDEAIAIAKNVATTQGWDWDEPIHARLTGRFFGEPHEWEIISNARCRGANVLVVLDATTGKIIRRAFNLR
jgi:hypothetical protein